MDNGKLKIENRKSAFTLSEVLIVLSIIGVIAALVVPGVVNSAPDQDVMKFKKANATFSKVIGELASSGKYFAPGDLGVKQDGTLLIDDGDSASANKKYLCEAFADLVSTKSKNCVDGTYSTATVRELAGDANQSTVTTFKGNLDTDCKNTSVAKNQIITVDGISWYEVSPGTTFGIRATFPDQNETAFNPSASVKYKVMCFSFKNEYDKDEIFAYAVRSDGKIIPGAKADVWMNYDIQRNVGDKVKTSS